MTRTIPRRLHELAQAAPEREILRYRFLNGDEITLTRAQLLQLAQSTAAQLAAAGANADDIVAIVQRHPLALVGTFLGAALLGAVPSILPFATEKLHPDRYKASMAALFDLVQPALLVTEPELYDEVAALLPSPAPEKPALLSIDVGATHASPLPEPSIDPNAIALLQHSSGTTGLQKGVALSHRAIFDQLDAYSQAIGFSDADIVVSWLPLYHDMGLIAGFLMPILSGARLVLMSPFDWVRSPQMLLRAISDQRGTFCWLPNFAYNFCAQKIRERDLEGVDLSSLRAVINCSEPVRADSHQLFIERFAPYGLNPHALATCYAMAETVFAVSQSAVGQPVRVDVVERDALRIDGFARPTADDQPSENIVSCGRPIEGMAVRVLDTERRPLPERRVGALTVRSPYMLTGYYHRPEATESVFHDGWYLTGDIGYVAEGEVFVLGREKDLLIVGGRNVYPQDLEALVNTVEGVHAGRVVAFGVLNAQAGTEDVAIVAEVEMDSESSTISANIRRIIANRSDVSVRYVKLVPSGWLIKTSSGKLARGANRDKFLSESSQ